MSESNEHKDDQDSEWEDSINNNAHNMLPHSDTFIADTEVNRRFLVTKDKTMLSMGSTTKYLEVLYDGSVRIRDVKKSTYSDAIDRPWDVFKKEVPSKQNKKGQNKQNSASDKSEKLKIYMDGKQKKRQFKFSTLDEKTAFFKLIEDLRKKKDRYTQKKKYSTEPFTFAPYEVVGFFIRNAIVFRNGSTIKYRDKLIAITNYRIVVVDPELINNSLDDASTLEAEDSNLPSPYNDPLDQSASYKQNTLKRGDHIIPALTIAHHCVYHYDVENGNTLKLETKDYRTITIDLSEIKNETLRTQSLFMMKRYLLATNGKDIFAFAGFYSVTRTKTPSHSGLADLSGFPELGRIEFTGKPKHRKFPTYDGNNPQTNEDKLTLYMQLKDSRYHITHFDELILGEYRRLGWNSEDDSCPFRVTHLNIEYNLCATYPKYLLLPRHASDDLVNKAARHRSRNRLPVITWSNSYNISLARSSQPQAGASHKRNECDEKLLALLNEMNSYSETFVICDCRPRVNAIANQYMKGKGFESGVNYEKSHIIFFDIENIHEMRKSVNSLKKCCENQFDSNWLKNLHETQWFQHITKIIQCSRRCANMIDKDKYSVLVHCSDGWDRTAQVCCLAQLLLDPYYRTFDGFLLLIQKEWLWFGHKFADRNSNFFGKSLKKDKEHQHKKRERSPIFLQFLDCCFQIMMQFPWAFDFTQDLLLEFANHCNSGRFGDFFCNSIKDRDDNELWLKTPSLFKYLSALWKLGRFRNTDYIPTKTVLRPRYAVRDMILWDEVYCRFTMHDKDRHSSSIFTHNHLHSHAHNQSVVNSESRHTFSSISGIHNTNSVTTIGKNRYHPRSPRISSSMFKMSKNAKNVVSNISPMQSPVPKKMKPPPPKRNANGKECEIEEIGKGMKPDMISVESEEEVIDNDEVALEVAEVEHSYSDSGSLPEKVKRIALLQKKVAQLESVLAEYQMREQNKELIETPNVYTPSMPPIEHYPLNDNDDSAYKKLLNAKGNIV